MIIHVTDNLIITVNGKTVVHVDSPFGTRLDVTKSRRTAKFYSRSPADVQRSVGLRYRVAVSPTVYRSLIATWWAGAKGFSLYQTHDRVSVLLRSAAIGPILDLLSAPPPNKAVWAAIWAVQRAVATVAASYPFRLILCETGRLRALIEPACGSIPIIVIPPPLIRSWDTTETPAVATRGRLQTTASLRASLVSSLARTHDGVPWTALGPDSLAVVPNAAFDDRHVWQWIKSAAARRPATWIITEQNPWAAGKLAQTLMQRVPKWRDILPTSLFLVRRRVIY